MREMIDWDKRKEKRTCPVVFPFFFSSLLSSLIIDNNNKNNRSPFFLSSCFSSIVNRESIELFRFFCSFDWELHHLSVSFFLLSLCRSIGKFVSSFQLNQTDKINEKILLCSSLRVWCPWEREENTRKTTSTENEKINELFSSFVFLCLMFWSFRQKRNRPSDRPISREVKSMSNSSNSSLFHHLDCMTIKFGLKCSNISLSLVILFHLVICRCWNWPGLDSPPLISSRRQTENDFERTTIIN